MYGGSDNFNPFKGVPNWLQAVFAGIVALPMMIVRGVKRLITGKGRTDVGSR